MRYRLAPNGVHCNDGLTFIPNDPTNRDWIEYQDWLQEGNEPDPPPATEPDVIPPP